MHLVRDDRHWMVASNCLTCLTHECSCCFGISPCGPAEINQLTTLINSMPQVPPAAVHPHICFVHMPSQTAPTAMLAIGPFPSFGVKLLDPALDSDPINRNPTFRQQVAYIAVEASLPLSTVIPIEVVATGIALGVVATGAAVGSRLNDLQPNQDGCCESLGERNTFGHPSPKGVVSDGDPSPVLLGGRTGSRPGSVVFGVACHV